MKDEITLLREENKRLNTIICVLTEKLQDTENMLYAYEKNKIGISDLPDGIPKNVIGISEVPYAYEKNKIGISDLPDGTPKNKIGISDLPDGIPKNKIGANEINMGMLMGELKVVMNKCTISALSNTAKTLAHLYTNPKCPQKDLMKLTKLSQDGMAKHFKALKTRNLIVKDASSKYVLSDAAIKMLEAARG